MSRPATAPDTIVLIHGFWMTPRSWEHWIPHYERKVFKSLANRHKAVGLTLEEFTYAFVNTFPPEEAKALYERYHIPASGAIVWGGVLANVIPGPQDAAVNYHNEKRAPLLFVSGSEDHIMPPAVQRSNAAHYKAVGTVTEVKEYDGYSHLLPAQKGWEAIADDVLDWALKHARGTGTAA